MRLRKQRGFALITAIWVLVVLLILVGGFAAMSHSEAGIARNYGDLGRARWAARAGLRDAETQLIALASEPSTALDDGLQTTITGPADQTTLDDATYSTVVQDEAGKININTAPAETLAAFFQPDVVANILAWRGASGGTTQGAETTAGAGDDYYTTLTPPYHCKNAPFGTVGELLLVKDVTRDLLTAEATSDGLTLADILTTVSVDDNTDADGNPRLNINTASQAELTQQFTGVLTAANITAIIRQRGRSQFQSVADLLSVQGITAAKLAQIYDRLTTSTAKTLPGLVNVNTAPAEVLAALPGMDDATAQLIIQHRTTQGPFNNVGELLTVNGMNPTLFRSVANLFTVRSRQFRVVSTGKVGDGLPQTTSCLLRLETSSGSATTRVLYWQE